MSAPKEERRVLTRPTKQLLLLTNVETNRRNLDSSPSASLSPCFTLSYCFVLLFNRQTGVLCLQSGFEHRQQIHFRLIKSPPPTVCNKQLTLKVEVSRYCVTAADTDLYPSVQVCSVYVLHSFLSPKKCKRLNQNFNLGSLLRVSRGCRHNTHGSAFSDRLLDCVSLLWLEFDFYLVT